MRVPIYQSPDFAYFASLNPVPHPEGLVHLVISTKWTNARNPKEEQISLRLILDRAGIQQLRDLLSEADAKPSGSDTR